MPSPHRSKAIPLVTNPDMQHYLVSRGVPEGVVHAGFSKHWQEAVTRIEMDPENGVTKAISSIRQREFVEATMEKPFASNYVMCIAGQTNDSLAQQIGLLCFIEALKKAVRIKENPPRAFWHQVYGNTKDDLRDGNLASEMTAGGRPGLIVLSNIYANSTMMKIEKTRDILSRYDHIPRILIVAGDNPFSFCSKVLFVKLNRVVYFGTKKG